MPTYEIRGVSVHFPHEAYPCQHDFMDRVIGALQNVLKGENALLESPTGTGKTLCLLSAALAWRSAWAAREQLEAVSNTANYETYMGDGPVVGHEVKSGVKDRLLSRMAESAGGGEVADTSYGQRRVPLIIYASRTHSQLAQVVKELSATVYRPKISVIGSREQLCINPAVKQIGSSGAQQALCQQLVKKKACGYNAKVQESLVPYKNACAGGKLFDIEEMVRFGEAHQSCPYFLAREGNADADVLFMPYNYLVDRKARGSLGIDLKNAVIVFDEAHNLEGICGDASSFDLTTDDLKQAMNEVLELSVILSNKSPITAEQSSVGVVVSEDDCKLVHAFLLSLHSTLLSTKLTDGAFTSRSDYCFDALSRCGISADSARPLLDRISRISKGFVEEQHARRCKGITCHLQSVENVLRVLYKPVGDDGKQMISAIEKRDAAAFRVYLTEEPSQKPNAQAGRRLSLWCFNPGTALRDLMENGVRSVILASGTLSPMASFAHELQLSFAQQLENMHVIGPDQIIVSVLRSGPNDVALNSSYSQRDSSLYKTELGLAICRTAGEVPGGLLVFFPTYAVMDSCLKHWKTTPRSSISGDKTIWMALSALKTPFVEPKSKGELNKIMDAYCKAIDNSSGSGAVFFAVCRGKVSEGLDFADAKGRAVIITGIPFAPVRDPKVSLKKDYLQDVARSSSKATLTGDEWYNQQALRAVNQAIGRVIRHRRTTEQSSFLMTDLPNSGSSTSSPNGSDRT